MSDYTYQDMMRMQSEAKKRVIEMHKRSKDVADSFNGKKNVPETAPEKGSEDLPRIPRAISYPAGLQTQPRHRENQKRPAPATDIRRLLTSAFGNLTDDDYERMFILSLCLLLTKEGSDESLVVALMYLLT